MNKQLFFLSKNKFEPWWIFHRISLSILFPSLPLSFFPIFISAPPSLDTSCEYYANVYADERIVEYTCRNEAIEKQFQAYILIILLNLNLFWMTQQNSFIWNSQIFVLFIALPFTLHFNCLLFKYFSAHTHTLKLKPKAQSPNPHALVSVLKALFECEACNSKEKTLIEIERIFPLPLWKGLKFSQCTFDMAIKDGFWSFKIVTYRR